MNGIITVNQTIGHNAYKIERFAILKESRGHGYGQKAFNFLVELIASKYNPCTITLNSQESVIGFYEKCGFIKEGEFFIEANINHIKMNKVIK